MSANRKLQTEIIQVLKKLEEGVPLFDDIWEKVYAAEQQSLKEKYEGDLKKEIKKLQRLRDQIKSWLGSSEIKDKAQLTEARKVIESKMEQFKICEKDTKTKAYSKEGLARESRMDPKEAERDEKRSWLNDCLEQLGDLVDSIEADIEKVSSGRGKAKNKDQIEKYENRIQKNRWHITRLEQILKLLDNEDLDPSQLDGIKDDVEYYIESAADDDGALGVDDEFDIYEELKLGAVIPPPVATDAEAGAVVVEPAPVTAAAQTPTLDASPALSKSADEGDAAGKSASTKKAVAVSTTAAASNPISLIGKQLPRGAVGSITTVTATVGKAVPKPAAAPATPLTIASPAKASPAVTVPVATAPVPSAAKVAASVGVVSAKSDKKSIPAAGASETATSKEAPVATVPQKDTVLQSSWALAAQKTSQPVPPLAPVSTAKPLAPLQTESSPILVTGSPTETPPAVAGPDPLTNPSALQAATTGSGSVSSSPPIASAPTPALSPKPPTPLPAVSASIQGQSAPLTQTLVGQPLTTAQAPLVAAPPSSTMSPTISLSAPQQTLQNNLVAATPFGQTPVQTFPSTLTTSMQPLVAASSGMALSSPILSSFPSTSSTTTSQLLQQQPTSSAPAAIGVSISQPKPFTFSSELQLAAQLLKQSALNAPETLDADKAVGYAPRNQFNTHPSFPTNPPSTVENPALFEKLPTDALFFAFYYQQGSYQQYLAAKKLKKQSWRFHKKYMTWFQRHEEPKIASDDYEEGTYVYFDYESGWCQRIKSEFKFEYSYLEDELNVLS